MSASRFRIPGISLAVLLLTAVLPARTGAGERTAVILKSPDDSAQIGAEHILYYRDSTGLMDAEALSGLPDSSWAAAPDKLYFGYSGSAVWLRADIAASGLPALFITEHHGIDRFDVWMSSGGEEAPEYLGRSGWAAPAGEPDPDAPSGVRGFRGFRGFSAVQAAGGFPAGTGLLIRMESSSSLAPTFIVMGERSFHRASMIAGLFQGGAVGFSMMILVFSLMILVSGPRREITGFLLLAAANGLMAVYLTGFGPLNLWHRTPWLTIRLGLTVFPVLGALSVRFFRIIMDTSRTPRFDAAVRILQWTLWAMIIPLMLLNPGWGYRIINILQLMMIPVVQGLLVTAVVLEIGSSVYLLSAWTAVLLAGIFQALVNRGVIPPIPWLYNTGNIIVTGLLLQNAMLGGTIVARSEMQRVREHFGRLEAERQADAARSSLAQSERMNDLAAMVSAVAHETATPLGNARLLSSEITERTRRFRSDFDDGKISVPDLEEYLTFTSESGDLINRALAHARDIMDGFRVVASDEATVEIKTVSPGDYLQRLMLLMKPLVKRTPHKLELAVETGRSLRTIPGYVSQVVVNLIVNALTHAFEGGQSGTITVTVRDTDGGEVEISVEDNGMGIPPGILPRIFDMHFTTAGERGGTGLGLAVSRHLAEGPLRGSLTAERGRSRGSAFTLRLGNLEDDKGAP